MLGKCKLKPLRDTTKHPLEQLKLNRLAVTEYYCRLLVGTKQYRTTLEDRLFFKTFEYIFTI
jgi:hypothetical protein